MNFDQTAPMGVSSLIRVHIVCSISYLTKLHKQMRDQMAKVLIGRSVNP